MKTVRIEFTKAVREAAEARANGKCEICILPFGAMRPEYHHRREAALGGDGSLTNCLCICPKCHRLITTAQAPVIAKAKRIEEKRLGLRRSRRPFSKHNDPWGKRRFGS